VDCFGLRNIACIGKVRENDEHSENGIARKMKDQYHIIHRARANCPVGSRIVIFQAVYSKLEAFTHLSSCI